METVRYKNADLRYALHKIVVHAWSLLVCLQPIIKIVSIIFPSSYTYKYLLYPHIKWGNVIHVATWKLDDFDYRL